MLLNRWISFTPLFALCFETLFDCHIFKQLNIHLAPCFVPWRNNVSLLYPDAIILGLLCIIILFTIILYKNNMKCILQFFYFNLRDGIWVEYFYQTIIWWGWPKYRNLSVGSRSIICQSWRLRQIIDLQDPDKSQYFAVKKFNNIVLSFHHQVCFHI